MLVNGHRAEHGERHHTTGWLKTNVLTNLEALQAHQVASLRWTNGGGCDCVRADIASAHRRANFSYMNGHKLWIRSNNDAVIRADRIVGLDTAAPDRVKSDAWVLRAEVLHDTGTRIVDLCWGNGDNFNNFAPATVAKAISLHFDRIGLLDLDVTVGQTTESTTSHPAVTTLDNIAVVFEAWDSEKPDYSRTAT